ncbi:serine/threonine-protein kinase ndrD isoform X2 [Apis mellifera caucasica]|nr:serine/threonine-protein kinase ndrD isoform X2 [Apis mellifera caucasica]KAG9437477.1 serine/threonine-protein kinase ndrD isoform X2 [Apis mellifera carnica]
MEGHSYVSCIKINGIPILPPMITKDIKRELSNYKENISDVPIETFKSSNENLEKTLEYDKDLNLRCKSENQINLVPSTVSRSESITSSNDSNTTTLIKSTTTETVSEIWKPQVPKTLNIIPLTLNNTNLKENEFQENNLDNLGDTPKLVRQGSYVLDTPSPILLAHMQMELTSSTCVPSSEYVPTSCANVNRRKEWNVAQTKVEWEYETKNKESVPIANFYSNIDHKMYNVS